MIAEAYKNKPNETDKQIIVSPTEPIAITVNLAAHTDLHSLSQKLTKEADSLLSATDREKLDQLQGRPKRIAQLLGSRHLLNQLHIHACNTPAKIEFSESGAPSIIESDFHCSIAHSHNAAIAAISSIPIGVDIELIQPRNLLDIAELFMSDKDQRMFKKQTPAEQQKFFFKRWCQLESIAKLKNTDLHHAYELTQQSGQGISSWYQVMNNHQICVSSNQLAKIEILEVSMSAK